MKIFVGTGHIDNKAEAQVLAPSTVLYHRFPPLRGLEYRATPARLP